MVGAVYGEIVSFSITGTNFTDNQGYRGGGVSGQYSFFNI